MNKPNSSQQTPLAELIVGAWYVGRGRNSNVGRWDGEFFLVIAETGVKAGPGPRDWTPSIVVKQEPYYTSEKGCFQPFRRIDEGEIVRPFGPSGWDAHYGESMILRTHRAETSRKADNLSRQIRQ